ncbi:FAD-binding and (Fe-S)-binding domain-containing protein [Kocuria massiliensis]|uniref:FAD-binding and (Fe-S)-binding domain-containing protein n=1 Tax=Kocuria massiliensis TaxID=1926282 RepID=UPI0022B96E77|nr:FAD-binding and (Fe-S)-binding domain-containing protein [Kocuria massiliensis]
MSHTATSTAQSRSPLADSSVPKSPEFTALERILGEDNIATSHREIDRLAMAHDASHYLLVPQGIVHPTTPEDVAAVMSSASKAGLPVTFRSGGTSLSGQSVAGGVMVDTRRAFRGIEVLDGGARVRVQPGATVASVNAALRGHGRKLGPDPASSSACTIGGVVANNSSGMSCGTEFNTYRTLESMVFVLPSGTMIDTSEPDADRRLRELEPELHEGLLRLRRRVMDNPASQRIIKHQFSMKNTMGYGVNALVDFDSPVEILEHLLIGSEGTLGFVASATFRTLEIRSAASTGLMVFPDLLSATSTVPALVDAGMATVELLDATSIAVAQRSGRVADALSSIDVDQQAALLVEFEGNSEDEIAERQGQARSLLDNLPLAAPFSMTKDRGQRNLLWAARNNLYAAVAGNRPTGTNALLEDVVVPVDILGETCRSLGQLFTQHGYSDSVIFGHAKDGNIHFMLNEQFAEPSQVDRYQSFTDDMVSLILGNDGSLKAEHGTGRIMAPYVRRQYGDELYEVMQEIKRLVDPATVLNPGVLLNDDPDSYVQNLKVAETVEEEVDRCVECGYCEPVCPSRDLTLTPRERIVIRREIKAAETRGDHELTEKLRRDWDYAGEQTCAVDGMCATRCPVDINTGDLIRRLRSEDQNPAAATGWKAVAHGWGAANTAAGYGLRAAKRLPWPVPTAITDAARGLAGDDVVPRYNPDLPSGGQRRAPRRDPEASFVFFPACVNAMFGAVDSEGNATMDGATSSLMTVAHRAGLRWATPEGIGSMCCGTPWKSKGFTSGYQVMSDRVLDALWDATRGGELPVVCDASSCTEGLETMKEKVRDAATVGPVTAEDGQVRDFSKIHFGDAVEFVADRVLPRLTIARKLDTLVLHPTCSLTHMGLQPQLEALGRAVAEECEVPLSWACCGYAGDRGMLHPELTAAATRAEAEEVNRRSFDAYASTNRTCEQGMTEATGRPYQNIVQLVEWASR